MSGFSFLFYVNLISDYNDNLIMSMDEKYFVLYCLSVVDFFTTKYDNIFNENFN